jgi:hypothetical protein
VTDVIGGVVLLIVLIGGYELLLGMSETPFDKAAATPTRQTPNPVVAGTGTVGGEIPKIAWRDLRSSVPADLDRAKAGSGDPSKGHAAIDDPGTDERDKPAERREAAVTNAPSSPPSVAHSAALERNDSIPGSSSDVPTPGHTSGGSTPEPTGPHTGSMKPAPGSRAPSPQQHVVLVRYGHPPFERASFKRDWLASRDTPGGIDFEYCQGFEHAWLTGQCWPARTALAPESTIESEENAMKMFTVAVATGFLLAPAGTTFANAQTVRGELQEHPRIMQAIHDIEDAIANMEAAPNYFGGHKAAAVAASREAVRQLREALDFRADRQPSAPLPGQPSGNSQGSPGGYPSQEGPQQ